MLKMLEMDDIIGIVPGKLELNEYVIENPGCVKHPGLFYGIEF